MDPLFRERIATLLEARVAVRGEMARLITTQPLDREALGRLRETVHELADQADALILTMVRHGAPVALVAAVEEVFDAFRDAERQIEVIIRRRRR